jgi:nucleotide-binding universal stress UspA family protein
VPREGGAHCDGIRERDRDLLLHASPRSAGKQGWWDVSQTTRQAACTKARGAVEQLARRCGIPRQAIHFMAEQIPDGILRLADETGADIVVMGAGARPRVQYSPASTASLVLEQSSCDVLVVKAPGFVSPVLVE